MLFRVAQSRAVLGKTPDLLGLAGGLFPPPARHSVGEIVRSTRRERAERRPALTAFLDCRV